MIDRRTLLVSLAGAAAGSPVAAQPADGPAGVADPWAPVLDRARGLDQLHALIVAQDGAPLVEEAVRGPALDRPVNVKSVSKTIVAALLGVAIDRGDLAGVDVTLGEVIPGLIPPGADPRVAGVTLEDLVTLRAGLARTSGAAYGAWAASPDWIAYALGEPMVAEPGSRMVYSTGSTHVLGVALAEATGETLLVQARTRLGDPLGIEIPAWTRDPQGRYLGGNQMALSPRALLAFGEMIRNNGRAGGSQVLSEDWIATSLQPRTRSPFSGLEYGYGWFLGRVGPSGPEVAMARGFGGQLVAVVPERRLTVVVTSDPTRPAPSAGYFGDLLALLGEAVALAPA